MPNKIWISTGASREEKSWKNVEVSWEKLVERFKSVKVTGETYAAYLTMTKDQQQVVKDVGGFVGGIVSGGRRKKNSVTARYLITLDIDSAPADWWDDLTMFYPNEMLMYSTHKHSSEAPRWRLIMPLSREVLSDEYEAIARKVAGNLGIEHFDPTTFQPERLMFWPSRAMDGEHECFRQEGKWLDADAVLNEYADWRDSSQWPISEKAKQLIRRGIDKQEDPLTKGGMIGVFCRTYGIEAAIEKFLGDVYEKTDVEDRWTYVMGSTFGGMMVYDDKFTFSHHSTDPSGGRLCNAFDLVRIHLYGDLDLDDGIPANKRPSYVKMTDMISKDELVKRGVVSEQVRNATRDFNDLLGLNEGAEEENLDWTSKLDVDKKGNVLNTIGNVVLILNNDERLKGGLAWDDFAKRALVMRDLPWRLKGDKFSEGLSDSDDPGYRNYLEAVYKVNVASKVKDAIELVIHQHSFHPVRNWLEGFKWDGKKRLDTLMIDYLGVEDSVYAREVTRKTLIAAVARVYEPGIKFDHVLLLIGPQGIGKSRMVSKLGGKWYSDTFGNLQTNSAMENIQGVWIMEIGELAGLKKHEADVIKLFIAKGEDRFRVAYGKRVDTFPRQCIFIGTSNDYEPLKDQSGGRRFWPLQCTKALYIGKEEIEQVWAEALVVYKRGEVIYLDKEIEGMAKEVQSEYTEYDERSGLIADYLNRKVPANWYDLSTYDRVAFLQGDETVGNPDMLRDRISVPEIWFELMKGTQKDMSTYNIKYIRTIMNNMKGWERKLIRVKGYDTQRGWVAVAAKINETLK